MNTLQNHNLSFDSNLPFIARPLSGNELREIADTDGMIRVIIPLDFDTMMDKDIDELNALMEQMIFGADTALFSLQDLNYTPHSCENGSLFIELTAFINNMLDED